MDGEAGYKRDEDGEEYECEVGDDFPNTGRVVEGAPSEAYAEVA